MVQVGGTKFTSSMLTQKRRPAMIQKFNIIMFFFNLGLFLAFGGYIFLVCSGLFAISYMANMEAGSDG
jgi:D-alanyl-lipoteichoic acid acyltransferase DltB (MBOAT superfamily)